MAESRRAKARGTRTSRTGRAPIAAKNKKRKKPALGGALGAVAKAGAGKRTLLGAGKPQGLGGLGMAAKLVRKARKKK